jgi:hypothetical protein
MPVDINREIDRVRAQPGHNWTAIALKTLQDFVNTLPPASTPASVKPASPTLPAGSGGSAPPPAAVPFTLFVNGQQVSSLNLNSALPSPPAWMASILMQLDSTVTPPNASGSFPNIGGVNAQNGATYTIQASDNGFLVVLTDTSAVAVTVPVATSMPPRFYCGIEMAGAAVATITPTTSTIDGLSSLTLSQNQGVFLFSDGTNYWTFRGRPVGPVKQVPTGTINGSNPTFTLSGSPSVIMLFKNGQLMLQGAGNDFTLSTNTITYVTASIPVAGDQHIAFWWA